MPTIMAAPCPAPSPEDKIRTACGPGTRPTVKQLCSPSLLPFAPDTLVLPPDLPIRPIIQMRQLDVKPVFKIVRPCALVPVDPQPQLTPRFKIFMLVPISKNITFKSQTSFSNPSSVFPPPVTKKIYKFPPLQPHPLTRPPTLK